MAVVACLLTATSVLLVGNQGLTGEIRGTVSDEDRAPLSNVEIQVRKLDRLPVSIRTRSDAQGSFRVGNLLPGRYRVIASRDGFIAETVELLRVMPGTSATARLFMEPLMRCQLANVPGTGHISGTVSDWTGHPAPAFVRLDAAETGDVVRGGISSGVNGRYNIDLVPPGRYTLVAWFAGLQPVTVPVMLEAGRELTINPRLVLETLPSVMADDPPLSPPQALNPAFGGAGGQVRDSGRGVIPGATATLRSAGGGAAARLITDRNGDFWFQNLAPGHYELRVELSGFIPHVGTIDVSSGRWTGRMVTLEIRPIEPNEHVVRWKLRRSERVVQIETVSGAMTLAVSPTDLLACEERGAYTGGSLEFVGTLGTSSPSAPLLRLLHNREKPLAPEGTQYALRLDESPQLVVLGSTGKPGAVVGRLVDGFDVVEKIRDQIKRSNGPVIIRIVSVSRMVFV